MFTSRDDYVRVIKLLLATLLDGDEPPLVAVDRDDMVASWTDHELAEADRYRLDVTTRPGTYDGRVPRELELRLLRDDAWEPDRDEESP